MVFLLFILCNARRKLKHYLQIVRPIFSQSKLIDWSRHKLFSYTAIHSFLNWSSLISLGKKMLAYSTCQHSEHQMSIGLWGRWDDGTNKWVSFSMQFPDGNSFSLTVRIKAENISFLSTLEKYCQVIELIIGSAFEYFSEKKWTREAKIPLAVTIIELIGGEIRW